MPSSSRRSGFRLPWTAEETDGDGAVSTASADATSAAAESPASAVEHSDAPTATSQSAATAETKDEPMTAADESTQPSAEPASTSAGQTDARAAREPAGGDNPFLRNLVDAMRHVAEETRAKSVVDLHERIEQRVAELRTASEERGNAMRKLADDEVAAVATWERTEVERIEAEAKRRSEERRARLETELAEDARRTEQEIEETKRRARAYESELDSFLAQLGEIRDPAEFVSAAQRMPPPPLGGDTAPSAPSPAASGAWPSVSGRQASS
jgi:hypothetical protein